MEKNPNDELYQRWHRSMDYDYGGVLVRAKEVIWWK
jgi:hypothetical protein